MPNSRIRIKRLLGRGLRDLKGKPDESCFNTILICIEFVTHQVPLSVPLNHYLVISLFFFFYSKLIPPNFKRAYR